MCDYSLHLVASRPAKLGDKLVCKNFKMAPTQGFAAADDPEVAVCLLPGTELAFETDVQYGGLLGFGRRTAPAVARFCQVDVNNPNVHHDALEFPDGRIVSLQKLRTGQRATVLQLPNVSERRGTAEAVTSSPGVRASQSAG
jgi:hypothetical protein